MKKDPQRLAAYFEDQLAPPEKSAVAAEIAASAEAQRTVDRYREIAGGMAAAEPELEALDLAGAVRRAAAAPVPPRRSRSWLVWSGALAAAACVALAVGLGDGVREKGGRGGAERWAGVSLHRVVGGRTPQPLDGAVGRGDGLLVSYSNGGAEPFDYLMVFVVDARGQVAWVEPAWSDPAADPAGIPIEKGTLRVEIPTLSHPSWSVGPATAYALFSRTPHHVREIEALLARSPLSIADGYLQTLSFVVEP